MKLKKSLAGILGAAIICGSFFASADIAQAADKKDVANEKEIVANLEKSERAIFPIGEPNTAYAKYFTGRSFLYPIEGKLVSVANVTFEPGCINFWHKHHGSCQVLAGVSGKGYYQIWGEEPQELLPGQSVTIPENVKHWHGAQHTSWFQHLSIMKEGATTEWLEPVDEKEYAKLK